MSKLMYVSAPVYIPYEAEELMINRVLEQEQATLWSFREFLIP